MLGRARRFGAHGRGEGRHIVAAVRAYSLYYNRNCHIKLSKAVTKWSMALPLAIVFSYCCELFWTLSESIAWDDAFWPPATSESGHHGLRADLGAAVSQRFDHLIPPPNCPSCSLYSLIPSLIFHPDLSTNLVAPALKSRCCTNHMRQPNNCWICLALSDDRPVLKTPLPPTPTPATSVVKLYVYSTSG